MHCSSDTATPAVRVVPAPKAHRRQSRLLISRRFHPLPTRPGHKPNTAHPRPHRRRFSALARPFSDRLSLLTYLLTYGYTKTTRHSQTETTILYPSRASHPVRVFPSDSTLLFGAPLTYKEKGGKAIRKSKTASLLASPLASIFIITHALDEPLNAFQLLLLL